MPIIKQGDALLTSGNAVASSEACCCQQSQPTSCECVEWCCVEPTLTINGEVLPFLTFDEYQASNHPCQCVFCVTEGSSAQLYIEYDDPNYTPSLVSGSIEFICPAPGTDPSEGKVLVQMTLLGPPAQGIAYGQATAQITYDCNGGEIILGEWTFAFGPYLQGVLSEWPPLTFASGFPCNPLP